MKKIKLWKTLCCVLLCICMVLSNGQGLFMTAHAADSQNVNLWVGGKFINSNNTFEGYEDEAVYDPATNTLTLNGVNVTDAINKDHGEHPCAILYLGDEPLTIVVNGRNYISTLVNSIDPMGGAGSYGIYSNGDLTLTGTGFLDVAGGTAVGTAGSLTIGENFDKDEQSLNLHLVARTRSGSVFVTGEKVNYPKSNYEYDRDDGWYSDYYLWRISENDRFSSEKPALGYGNYFEIKGSGHNNVYQDNGNHTHKLSCTCGKVYNTAEPHTIYTNCACGVALAVFSEDYSVSDGTSAHRNLADALKKAADMDGTQYVHILCSGAADVPKEMILTEDATLGAGDRFNIGASDRSEGNTLIIDNATLTLASGSVLDINDNAINCINGGKIVDFGVTVWDMAWSHTHTSYGSNSFKWTDNGDGTHSKIADCKTCGVKFYDGNNPDPKTHVAAEGAVADCRGQKCNLCGAFFGEVDSSKHVFDESGICTICGEHGAVLAPEMPNGENGWYINAKLLAPEGCVIAVYENGPWGDSRVLPDGIYTSITYWQQKVTRGQGSVLQLTWKGNAKVDGTMPVISKAEVADVTTTTTMSVLVEATDNLSGVSSYELTTNDSNVVVGAYADGQISVSNMTPGTTYTFTLTVKDNAGNVATKTIKVTTEKQQITKITDPTAKNLTYNGLPQELLNAGAAVGGVMKYSMEKDGTYTAEIPKASTVGTYTVWYKVEGEEGYSDTEAKSIQITIKKAPLTITAKDHTIVYGDLPEANGVSYEGFVNGETEAVLIGTITYTYNYAQSDKVGVYTITPGGVSSDNYEITFVNGNLTVEKKAAKLEVEDQNIVHGDTIDDTKYSVTGLVTGDTAEVTLTGSTTDVTANGSIDANVAIFNAQGEDVTACYDLTILSGKLSIKPDTSILDELTEETVKPEDKEILEDIIKDIDEYLKGDDISAEERNELENDKQKAEDLLELLAKKDDEKLDQNTNQNTNQNTEQNTETVPGTGDDNNIEGGMVTMVISMMMLMMLYRGQNRKREKFDV